jgi:hypothetical protein
MKELIKHIFIEKEFIIDENSLGDGPDFLAARTDKNKFDFFTIVFINESTIEKELLKEKIEEYLIKNIKIRQGIVGLEKNLSMLILLEVESLEQSQKINSFIYDIEEDPFDFKKYVLVYTQEQVSKLKSLIGTMNGQVVSYINQFLNDSMKFSQFKRQEKSDDTLVYDLITKLFIKLPFLNIPNYQQDITKLYKEIVDSIEVQDKELWESLLNLADDTKSEPSLEQILECIGVDVIE